MRIFLALAFVFICFSGASAWAQGSDAVTDDDVKRALHGGGAPVSSAPREYPAAPEQSDDDVAVPTQESDVQPVTQGAATDLAPAPSSHTKNSLMDLKASQDDLETDESAPALQAIGEGAQAACPSREVAATVKMPDTMKMTDPDGQRTKARKCEDAFERIPDACDPSNPCTDCDNAVKLYSDACMYVENSEGMKDIPNTSVGVGYNAKAAANPVSRIPYQQGRKP